MSNTGTKSVEERVEEAVRNARETVEAYPERVEKYRRYHKYLALFAFGVLCGADETGSMLIGSFVVPELGEYAFSIPYGAVVITAVLFAVLVIGRLAARSTYKDAEAFLGGDSR